MVSCTLPQFSAELVRLRHGDESSDGPGALADVVQAEGAGRFPGRVQRARPGSYGTADLAVPAGPVSLDLWLMPSIPRKGTRQGVLVLDSGVGLVLDGDGTLLLELPGAPAIAAPGTLLAWEWVRATAVVDPQSGVARLRVASSSRPDEVVEARGAVFSAPPPATRVLLAATDVTTVDGISGRAGGFDGRIEAPVIYAAALDLDDAESIAPLATWALERQSHTREAPDAGPQRAHMTLEQLPQRLVLGHRDRADAVGDVPLDRLNAVHFHA